jgi:hypothetical protein
VGDIRQSGSYATVAKKPGKTFKDKVIGLSRRSWYFERLLVFLLIFILPVIALEIWNTLSGPMALRLEADRLAANLRRFRSQARENHAFVLVVGIPPGPQVGSYLEVKSSKSQPKSERMPLRQGISVTGKVVFDPLGVPDSATKFTIRQGFEKRTLQVDWQGFVSQQ